MKDIFGELKADLLNNLNSAKMNMTTLIGNEFIHDRSENLERLKEYNNQIITLQADILHLIKTDK